MLEIPEEVAKLIPIYDGKKPEDDTTEILWVRFVEPQQRSAWYVARFDGSDVCYGLMNVVNFASTFDEFRLSDLTALASDFGGGAQLDEAFEPTPALQVLAEISGHH